MTGRSIPWAMTLALLLLWQHSGAEADQCRMTSPCFFDCGDTVMDMTALKTHVFHDVMDSKGQNKFSYSPCGTFSEGHGCRNTHVCQVDILDSNKTINIGSSVSVSLSPSGKHSHFTYSHRAMGVNRTTTVTVVCGSVNEAVDPSLKVRGETPDGSGKYMMSLTSSHACFQAKPTATTVKTTSAKPNVTTEVTTHKHNVTTAHTTPSKHNATTEARNVTTHVTTPAGHNVTTASRNVTTHVTTPASNVTTVVTTHVTGNVTTAHMTTAGKNVTIPGSSSQTTQGLMTTSPFNGADDLSRFSAERVMAVLLMATVTALASF